MGENRACASPTPRKPLDTDAIERAVLGHLLDLHPIQLTIDELVREMTDAPDDFAARDAVQRAVRQLIRSGLLHGRGQFVLPTRTAVRAFELLGG